MSFLKAIFVRNFDSLRLHLVKSIHSVSKYMSFLKAIIVRNFDSLRLHLIFLTNFILHD